MELVSSGKVLNLAQAASVDHLTQQQGLAMRALSTGASLGWYAVSSVTSSLSGLIWDRTSSRSLPAGRYCFRSALETLSTALYTAVIQQHINDPDLIFALPQLTKVESVARQSEEIVLACLLELQRAKKLVLLPQNRLRNQLSPLKMFKFVLPVCCLHGLNVHDR